MVEGRLFFSFHALEMQNRGKEIDDEKAYDCSIDNYDIIEGNVVKDN
jgi:hypothetical protein